MTGRFNLPGQNRPSFPPNYAYAQAMAGMGPDGQPAIQYGTMEDNLPPGITAARQARRLYVGSITLEGNEENIAAFFNEKMKEQNFIQEDKAEVQNDQPVLSVQVNHEKSYAFLEFRSPEEASSAMSFDGIMFQGQVLKIRRPKDYLGTEFMSAMHVPGVVSTNVPDTPHKVFIGGLPSI